jgi:hypothetical protein
MALYKSKLYNEEAVCFKNGGTGFESFPKSSEGKTWYSLGTTDYTIYKPSFTVPQRNNVTDKIKRFLTVFYFNNASVDASKYVAILKNGIEQGRFSSYKNYGIGYITFEVKNGDVISFNTNLTSSDKAHQLYTYNDVWWNNLVE